MKTTPPSKSRITAQDYLHRLLELLNHIDTAAIERIAGLLCAARFRAATVYVAGNGGSAATATHLVNDLGKATKSSECLPMRVMSLVDNLSWLTALANDEGYDVVFSGQLENFARPGDILVVISASGNSSNLVRAVDLARERGVLTVGLLGFDGGLLKDIVDEVLWIPTEKGAYELVEDCHTVLCHTLTKCVIQECKISLDGRQ